MTTRLGAPAPSAEGEAVPPHIQRRLRVDEYERMIEVGILGEEDRVELLGGVLVEMSPQSPKHAHVIRCLTRTLTVALGDEFTVCPQLPLALGDESEPEPDMAVIGASEATKTRHPRNAVLVIEVSGDSLAKDRQIKGAIYAAAVIPHYWIVNVEAEEVEVYGDPDPAGRRYRMLTTLGKDDTLQAASLPSLAILVSVLFD